MIMMMPCTKAVGRGSPRLVLEAEDDCLGRVPRQEAGDLLHDEGEVGLEVPEAVVAVQSASLQLQPDVQEPHPHLQLLLWGVGTELDGVASLVTFPPRGNSLLNPAIF